MTNDWIGMTKDLRAGLREMRAGAPEVMKAFAGIAQAALAKNALEPKTKELIALAISVAVRCDDCIAFHAKAAVDQGATSDEVHETLGMAIYMVPSLRAVSVSLLAGAGVMAIIIGFASQQAVSNIVSGMFIVAFSQYRHSIIHY